MTAQNPTATFSNFEEDWNLKTSASANSVGDVIPQDGGSAVLMGSSTAAGTVVAARIAGPVLGLTKASGTSWSQGAELYWDNVNLVITNVPTLYPLGYATEAHVSADLTAGVILTMRGSGSLIGSSAQVTGLTGTAEAVAATINIPANLLIPGEVLRLCASLAATGENGTDTLQVRLRIGGLTGTVVADTGAVQCAVGTGAKVSADLQVGAVSATVGTLYGAGEGKAAATLKTTASSVTTLNNTAAIACVVTYVFSSGSASDTANLNTFTVERLGR